MAKGIVNWFSDKKGYGFIRKENGPDIFVHYSSIHGDGFRTLAEGEHVTFEMEQVKGGHSANNVLKS